MNSLRELMLFDLGGQLSTVENTLYDLGPTLMPGFLFFGIILAFLTDLDFLGVIKRAVLCLIAVGIFQSVFVHSVDFGLDVGNSLLSKNNYVKKEWSNSFSLAKQGFKAARKRDKTLKNDESWYDSLKNGFSINASSLSNDFLGFFLFLLSNLSLFFVKVTFTLIYYMIPLTLPIVALVNILPITKKALEGSLLSIVWVGTTPIVVAIMLEILNGIISGEDLITNASFLSRSALGICFALYLISSFTFSLKLVGQGTIGDALAGPIQSFGTGIAVQGIKFMKDITAGKAFGKGKSLFQAGPMGEPSPVRRMTMKQFGKLNQGREDLFNSRDSILNSKPITAQQLQGGEKPKLSIGEAATVSAASMLNPIKSATDISKKRKLAKESLSKGRPDQLITSEAATGIKNGPLNQNNLEIRPRITKDGKVQTPTVGYHNAITNNYRKPDIPSDPRDKEIPRVNDSTFKSKYTPQSQKKNLVTGFPKNNNFPPADPNFDINQEFSSARRKRPKGKSKNLNRSNYDA